MGRMVECGACESRFNVNDEVIQKATKLYPGERDHDALRGFTRVEGPKIGMDAATPIPRGPHEKGYFSPISKVGPMRLALGWVGALLILVMTALLFLGMLPKDMTVATQALLALGVAVVGVALIVSANPRKRLRSLMISGLAAVVLLSMHFVFLSKLSPGPAIDSEAVERRPQPTEPVASPEELDLDQLRAKLGTKPLELEVGRLAESGSNLRAYGIWLRDMNESNRISVRDYILRTTGASLSSVIYPRGNREYLMVLTGLDKSIEDIAAICSKIGGQPKIHPELQLIEIKVDSAVFLEGPINKLTDKGDPAFYDLNKRELESVQLDRVERAVKRLADAEPTIYREDITRHLVVLAAIPQVEFIEDVCKALLIWAVDPTVANEPLLRRLNQLHTDKKKVPRSLVAMLAKGKATEAIPVVEQLWIADATNWEPMLTDFGTPVEKSLLARYGDLEVILRHSATRILGKVGTRESIPVLEAARPRADPELTVLIESAIRSIRERN